MDTFDEELRIETSSGWLVEMFGAQPPHLRRVRVGRHTLRIEGMPTVPRHEIANAFLVSEDDQLRVVVLRDRGRRAVVHFASRESAEEFLRALHYSKVQQTMAFRVLGSPRMQFVKVLVFTWIGCILYMLAGGRPQNAIAIALTAFALAVVIGRLERELVVGRDGVTISRFGRPRRFISYADIESLNRFAEAPISRSGHGAGILAGIVLHLRNGEAILLPTTVLPKKRDELIGAYERMTDSLTEWRAGNPNDDLDLLHRGARSTKEWLAALKEMGRDERDAIYRAAPVDRDVLLKIAENPTNQAHSRVAAAIVLRENWTTEERARLESSSKTIAEPRLRVAMDRVLKVKADKKEDEDLERAFDDLDSIEKKIR